MGEGWRPCAVRCLASMRWPCRESTSAGPTSSQHIPWRSTSKRTVESDKSCTRILEFGRIKLHICLTQNGVAASPPLQRVRRIDFFFCSVISRCMFLTVYLACFLCVQCTGLSSFFADLILFVLSFRACRPTRAVLVFCM